MGFSEYSKNVIPPIVIPAQAGTSVRLAERLVKYSLKNTEAFEGPGLRRDDGIFYGVFSDFELTVTPFITTDKSLNFILSQFNFSANSNAPTKNTPRSTHGDTMKISGTFDVNLAPLESGLTGTDGINFGRMSIDKTFHGELQACSKGEMLSAMSAVKGSAGYVAIEQVSGSLCGKKGSFVLQHFGTMDKGQGRLILEVVPDSGAGELSGLVGTMYIDITDGKHFYTFDFEGEK